MRMILQHKAQPPHPRPGTIETTSAEPAFVSSRVTPSLRGAFYGISQTRPRRDGGTHRIAAHRVRAGWRSREGFNRLPTVQQGMEPQRLDGADAWIRSVEPSGYAMASSLSTTALSPSLDLIR